MWSDESRYAGKRYRLERTLNSPQSLRRPHPPILIGGGGEKKTLRMVAQYCPGCNLFAGPDLERKLDVLRGHCEAVGRDYHENEKTVMMPLDPGSHGENVDALLEQLRGLADRCEASPCSSAARRPASSPRQLKARRRLLRRGRRPVQVGDPPGSLGYLGTQLPGRGHSRSLGTLRRQPSGRLVRPEERATRPIR